MSDRQEDTEWTWEWLPPSRREYCDRCKALTPGCDAGPYVLCEDCYDGFVDYVLEDTEDFEENVQRYLELEHDQ